MSQKFLGQLFRTCGSQNNLFQQLHKLTLEAPNSVVLKAKLSIQTYLAT